MSDLTDLDRRLGDGAENARAAAAEYGEAMIAQGRLICASWGYAEATRLELLRRFYAGKNEGDDDE